MNPRYCYGFTVVGRVYVFNRVVLDCGGIFPTFLVFNLFILIPCVGLFHHHRCDIYSTSGVYLQLYILLCVWYEYDV